MTDCPVSVGQILADKYRVESILGHGGMGVVVSATHLELDQLVAMKFLLPNLAENREASERFRREARAAVKIRSEHVARVLDVGTMEGGVPYMVMEYLDGTDLSQVLREAGALPIETAADYVLQASEAIAVAHSVGIVHRDLKPANLFLTRAADGQHKVKVLDFGISKSITGDSAGSNLSLTRTAAMVGSPLYMSPEQLESARDVDARTDIWSLGVILFELTTGSVPFLGDSIPQLVRAVLAADRAKVNDLIPDAPEQLEQVVSRCLAQKRDNRYRDISAFVTDLSELVTGGNRRAQSVLRILESAGPPVRIATSQMPAAQASAAPPTRSESPRRGQDQAPIGGTSIPIDLETQQGAHLEVASAAGRALNSDAATQLGAGGKVDTVSSWGRTGDEPAPAPARSGKRGLVAGLAAAGLALAGVTVWFASSGGTDPVEASELQSSEPSTSAHSATERVQLPPQESVETVTQDSRDLGAEPTSASSAAVAVPSPTAPPLASATEQPGSAAADQSGTPSVRVAQAVTAASPKKAAPAVKRRPRVTRPRRKARASQPTPAPAPAGQGVTDFGGRR